MEDPTPKPRVNAWISTETHLALDALANDDGGGVVRSDVVRAALTVGLAVLGQLSREDRMARYGAERLAL